MPYIAKTNGGSEVLEIRIGALTDIDEADRDNWRLVTETRDQLNSIAQIFGAPTFVVDNDGVVFLHTPAVNLPSVLVDCFTARATTVEKRKLTTYAADLRWKKQQSPLTLPNGAVIDASEASKAKIAQALTVLEKEWAETINFKAMNEWIVVDLAGLTMVAQALVQREQALFDAEKAIAENIESGDITTIAQINNFAWPA